MKKIFYKIFISLLIFINISIVYAQDIDIKPFFEENFNDVKKNNNNIITTNHEWFLEEDYSKIYNDTSIKNGDLNICANQYMQKLILDNHIKNFSDDLCMDFTINVKHIGNAGHSERPIAIIIPRTNDENFKKYYAVTYFLETKRMGRIVANLYKCKWAIVNTNSKNGLKPLVEGYFLLRENVDYKARLVIKNTKDDNVKIQFYIDGPINPQKKYEPIVEYIDSSDDKILSNKSKKIAFGSTGYSNDGWGHNPVVQYDNIKLYDIDTYDKYKQHIKDLISIEAIDLKSKKFRDKKDNDKINYLINQNIVNVFENKLFKPNEYVTIKDFLISLLKLKENHMSFKKSSFYDDIYIKKGILSSLIRSNEFLDFNKPITKNEASLLIHRFFNEKQPDPKLLKFLDLDIKNPYYNSLNYCFQNGHLKFDNFKIDGEKYIKRRDYAKIILSIMDDDYRKINYKLEVPNIISTHGIFQRNSKIPIWGRGHTGDTINVKFNNQVKTTIVKDGYWYLELDEEKAGGPYDLLISDSFDQININDILIGDVFLVAGQSNAEMYLYECNYNTTTKNFLLDKNHIRYYKTEQVLAVKPKFNAKGNWNLPSYWYLDWTSAIGSFYVEKLLELNRELKDIPIGIIPLTYGGSTIELFLPKGFIKRVNHLQHDHEPIMSGYWNGYMDCITPYAIKGVLYYQGENSTQLGFDYEFLLRNYIKFLRQEFKNPLLPIFLVQISGYGENYYETDIDSWPIIRAVQMRVANTTNNVGIVTAIDLADKDPLEIHPKDKKPIGRRIAYLATDMIYNKRLNIKSIQSKNITLENNIYIIDFDDENYDLKLYDKDISGFEIKNSKDKWVEAKAKIAINGQELYVYNDEIKEPKGVRYAWRNYPSITLYDKIDNLPVLPFNSEVDLNLKKEIKKSKHKFNIFFHGLEDNDAIMNVTRDKQFRMIKKLDEQTLYSPFGIINQEPGDLINKYKRKPNQIAYEGTNSKILKIKNHGLKKGDCIRNNSRFWRVSEIKNIVDENTVELENLIENQNKGDEIEIYEFIGITTLTDKNALQNKNLDESVKP
ncbi:MAG: sialate O-acetylesterase [Peptostreptococcaceae bacterium]|nr:sialate O-acetylesterase [Peptostreptococcaceae bacterium]